MSDVSLQIWIEQEWRGACIEVELSAGIGSFHSESSQFMCEIMNRSSNKNEGKQFRIDEIQDGKMGKQSRIANYYIAFLHHQYRKENIFWNRNNAREAFGYARTFSVLIGELQFVHAARATRIC